MLTDVKASNGVSLAALALASAQPHHPPPRHAFSLRRALVVLFSRGRLIAVVVAAVVLATLAGIVFLPAHYRSEAKLMVRLGRESVVIDPTARIGQAAVPMEGRDKEINSEIELLKSRRLSETVVSQIGPNRILGRVPGSGSSAKLVAEAIARVEEKANVEAIPDSNILAISYDSPDPELSRDVVARLIDAYLDERSRVYRDRGDLKFFQGQLDSARRQQALVQRKLRELRDSTGVADPDQQRKILLTRVDAMQHDIDAAKADLAAVASSIDALTRQLATMPEKHVIVESSGSAMDSVDTARTRLADLRIQEADFATRYSSEARPLKIVRQKIAAAERELAATASQSSLKTVGVNHMYEELNLRRQGELASQSSLQSRVASLEAARVEAQSGLTWIDEVSVKTQAVEQDVALAAANVAKYAEAYEQARIDEQMGQERIGNISVAEPPVLPLRAKGPSRSLLGMAGLFLAMALGLCSAFVADALDHSVRNIEHLNGLGLAQVISIPYDDEYGQAGGRGRLWPRKGSWGEGAAGAMCGAIEDSHTELTPMAPLRALIRDSADPAALGARAAASRGISDLDLRDGATLMITDENGTGSIHVRSADVPRRPAGPLTVSPRILAAIRGAVDLLVPLNGPQQAAAVIGVIGARCDEGASTIAVHLAIALAHRLDSGLNDGAASQRVLLVDSDVECPTASSLAGAAGARGLGDWVAMRTADTEPLDEMVVPTRQRLLDVLPAGLRRERSPLGPRMPQVLQALGQTHRYVIVDLPSVMDSDAAAQMAGLCDAVVFVCQSNQLRMEAAQQTLRRLREAGAEVALAVLNKRRYPVPEWAYRLS